MGTWGPNIFQSDGVLDYLGEFIDQLSAANEDILADTDRFALDEDGPAIFMPNIEILCILCEQIRVAPPPKLSTVNRWKERYLAMYDDEIEGLSAKDGFAQEWRTAIEHAFIRLARVSSKWYKTGSTEIKEAES